MPKLFQDEDPPPDEDLAAGVPSMAPSDPLSMTMPWVGAHRPARAEATRKMARGQTWYLKRAEEVTQICGCLGFCMFLRNFDLVDPFPCQSCKGRRPYCLCQRVRQANSCIIQCAGYNLGDTCNVRISRGQVVHHLPFAAQSRTCTKDLQLQRVWLQQYLSEELKRCHCLSMCVLSPELHVEERIEGLSTIKQ